jgi:hypothetical protein
MKNTRANISLFELSKITQQKNKLLHALDSNNSENNTSTVGEKDKGKTTMSSLSQNKSNVNATLIGEKSSSHTPPFLLTFEIYNINVHNFLVDSGASSNVMPYFVCKKLNVEPKKPLPKLSN